MCYLESSPNLGLERMICGFIYSHFVNGLVASFESKWIGSMFRVQEKIQKEVRLLHFTLVANYREGK